MLLTAVLTSCNTGGSNADKENDTTQGAPSDTSSDTDTSDGENTPTVPVSGVTLNKRSLILVKMGSEKLTATVASNDTTDKTLTWSTSNASVATVADGVVTAVDTGTATITVTTANGKTATCEVTVVASTPDLNFIYSGTDTITIIEYIGNDTNVVIPAYIDEKKVTCIGEGAFFECDSLTSITIPDSVTSIGEGAFRYCDSLRSVYINNITKWCEIDFASYYANPLYNRANLYLNGTLVTELIIPDSVKSIGEKAFSGYPSLTSITIPNSVTSIGSSAFYECSSLTSITIPNSVTSIGSSAFYDCDKLSSITIGNSVTSIGSLAFAYCYICPSVYITDIAKWCEIDFAPYSANPLNNEANLYLNGTLVTELIIPDSVTSIGNYAFYGCDNLKSITIPDSVTSIGIYAFYNCNRLSSVTFENANDWWYASSSTATSGTSISSSDLSNASTAADYLSIYRYEYCKYFWSVVLKCLKFCQTNQ